LVQFTPAQREIPLQVNFTLAGCRMTGHAICAGTGRIGLTLPFNIGRIKAPE